MIILSSSNFKTEKGESFGYRTFNLSLAPAKESGVGNVCPHSSAGCRETCISKVGFGHTPSVQRARLGRTRWFFADEQSFLDQVSDDIDEAAERAGRSDLEACFRLNCFSDIPWENRRFLRDAIERHSDLWFYDYTKWEARALAYWEARDDWPENYHLTFSRSERNGESCAKVLAAGGHVAVPFGVKDPSEFPATFMGYPVVSGEDHDLRFLDPEGPHIIGLRGKGRRAWTDETGFVVHGNGGAA